MRLDLLFQYCTLGYRYTKESRLAAFWSLRQRPSACWCQVTGNLLAPATDVKNVWSGMVGKGHYQGQPIGAAGASRRISSKAYDASHPPHPTGIKS